LQIKLDFFLFRKDRVTVLREIDRKLLERITRKVKAVVRPDPQADLSQNILFRDVLDIAYTDSLLYPDSGGRKPG
jgi:hypothetical protein